MFAKKPPIEPKLPDVPPVLRISGPPIILEQQSPPGAMPQPLESISQVAPNDRIAYVIIAQAFREDAEQITLTPDGQALLVHYLIADEWKETMRIPAEVAPGVVTAFKSLAGLPIWEHRMALQGLIVVQYGSVDYDVHVFITPTRQGEKITLRIESAEHSLG